MLWKSSEFKILSYLGNWKDKIRVICDKIIMIFSYRSGLQAKIIEEIIFGEND